MGKFIDLTGKVFGRLKVLERVENSKNGQPRWKCHCECGNECVVQGNKLRNGITKSCGCLQKEYASESHLDDLCGRRFGRLEVIGRAENKSGKTTWLCRCECGNECVVRGECLKRGDTQSCGCLNKARIIEANTTHGMSNSKFHHIWKGIKQRCLNVDNPEYKNYGGRGIKMYEPWLHDFQAFYEYISQLEHFGEERYSLDRINNDGNYEPDNLRWADAKTQNRNKRSNILVEYNGEWLPIVEAAEKAKINKQTLWRRIRVDGDSDPFRLN